MFESLKSHWFIACASSALDRNSPVGATILGVPVVLFRADGQAAALLDRCPHRNVALSDGRMCGGLVECCYHGWQFDSSGACRHIPGRVGSPDASLPAATKVAVAEYGGFVWVNVGDGAGGSFSPTGPIVVAMADSRFDVFQWQAEAECSLVDGLENLLDACHPHFAHAGLVRSSRERQPVEVTVRRTAGFVEARYVENCRPRGLIPRLMEGERKVSVGRYFPPATAQLEYAGPAGPRFLLTSMFTPSDAGSLRIHSVLATPKGRIPGFAKEFFLKRVFGRVLRQDQEVLAKQQRNVARFGGENFASTQLDVMRPHILRFLTAKRGEPSDDYERTFTMDL